MEFELKTGPQGHVYFPKLIRENFGAKMKFLPDSIAGAIYPESAKTEDVIASLEVIIQQLKLQQRKNAPSKRKDPKRHSTKTNFEKEEK